MGKIFTITEGTENLGALKSGGQGSVYKARRRGEIITAIKILPTPISSETEEDKNFISFQNEVQKLKRVNEFPNPNVVNIIASGITTSGDLPYIEMDYIEGPDLGELLKQPYDPIFTIKEVIKVADHLSNALAHCHHADVKHGDIKSNNVKFNQRTGNYILLDFGLSVMSDEQRRTSIRHAGAIEFMAPEQSSGIMLFETDVYSFGIILFELLAGTVPFPLNNKGEMARNAIMVAHMESSPPDILSLRKTTIPDSWSINKKEREMQVPSWVVRMIYKCLEKDPANRFRNGNELQDYINSAMITEETEKVSIAIIETENAKTNELQLKNEIEQLELQVAEKDNLIEDLQMKVELKEKALYQFQYVEDYNESKRKGISKSLFLMVLFAAFGLAGFTAYNSFIKPFKKANVDTAMLVNQKPVSLPDTSSAENRSAKKTKAKLRKNGQVPLTAADHTDETIVTPVNNFNPGRKYNVINTAYFHDKPDASKRNNSYLIARRGTVTALDEKNDFIYVVIVNREGKVARGWIMKKDLSLVPQ